MGLTPRDHLLGWRPDKDLKPCHLESWGLTMADQQIQKLLDKMWLDYTQLNPSAKKIYDSFVAEGERVLNDHVAYRTFNHKKLGIQSLAQHFEKYGYQDKGEYVFKEKKLYAKHYEHPDKELPKIFISELELEKVEPFIADEVEKMVQEVPSSLLQSEEVLVCGRPWKMSYKTYLKLAEVSEYASWVAAFGFRPNHFTVNINALKKFKEVRDVNAFIRAKGFELNQSGGEIKGTPQELLEQSSTMAKDVQVSFSDGSHSVPACYYEFAKRYNMPSGELYQGFIAKSADKIFESTNRAR